MARMEKRFLWLSVFVISMFYSNKYLLGAFDIGDVIGPWETKMRRKHAKTWFNWSYQTLKNLIYSMISVYKLIIWYAVFKNRWFQVIAWGCFSFTNFRSLNLATSWLTPGDKPAQLCLRLPQPSLLPTAPTPSHVRGKISSSYNIQGASKKALIPCNCKSSQKQEKRALLIHSPSCFKNVKF